MKINVYHFRMVKGFLLLLLPFLFASCIDEDETLGLDLVNGEDLVNVNVYNPSGIMNASFFKEDSLETANYRYNVVGEYFDNEFGLVSSDIYTQLNLSTSSVDFSSYAIDSVLLNLAYIGGFTGDTLVKSKEMDVYVYEVSEEIDSTKKYGFCSVATNSEPIFNGTKEIKYESDNDSIDPHLSIKLSDAFVNKIKTFNGTNDDFCRLFKGIKIQFKKKNATGGMIAYVDMSTSLSGIAVYYRQNDKNQKYLINFPANGNRFMHYGYDFSSSHISDLNISDTLSGNNEIYLGSMGISMAKINIDELLFRQKWQENVNCGLLFNNTAINSAILEIPVSSSNKYSLNTSTRILCYRKYVSNGNTNLVLIHDAQLSDAFYGGFYDNKSNSFKMNIGMHLANLLNGNIEDADIYLVLDSRRSTATRIILNGPLHPVKPASIKITYSKQ